MPQDAKAQRPLGTIVGGLKALVVKKAPQCVHFTDDLARQTARVGFIRPP